MNVLGNVFNFFPETMALKVLVGCKRVIDYAVKIRVRPDNLGVRKPLKSDSEWKFLYLLSNRPGGDRGSEAQYEPL